MDKLFVFALIVIGVGLLAMFFGKSTDDKVKRFGEKTFKFGTTAMYLGGAILAICLLAMYWPEGKPDLKPAMSISSPIEMVLVTWKSWKDMHAPVGEFAYSDVPPGKKFDFDPMGKVFIHVEGRREIIKYDPGDPEPDLGTVYTRVGFMSRQQDPVRIVRKVER